MISKMILISDVITAVSGKLFSFVKDSKMNKISEFRLSLDQTAAAEKYTDFNRYYEKNIGSFNRLSSPHNQSK